MGLMFCYGLLVVVAIVNGATGASDRSTRGPPQPIDPTDPRVINVLQFIQQYMGDNIQDVLHIYQATRVTLYAPEGVWGNQQEVSRSAVRYDLNFNQPVQIYCVYCPQPITYRGYSCKATVLDRNWLRPNRYEFINDLVCN